MQLRQRRFAFLHEPDAFAQHFALAVVAAVVDEVFDHGFELRPQIG
jgi:hypothetical protein